MSEEQGLLQTPKQQTAHCNVTMHGLCCTTLTVCCILSFRMSSAVSDLLSVGVPLLPSVENPTRPIVSSSPPSANTNDGG